MLPVPAHIMWTAINFVILLAAVASAAWVWRDATRRRNPWAPTWAVATLLLFPLALLAYLLASTTRGISTP